MEEKTDVAGITIQQSTLTRKERREQKKYQPVLLKLVNEYLNSKDTNEIANPEMLRHHFNNLRNSWKNFVHKWNRNPKYNSVLRDADFKDLINDTIKKFEDEKKNTKN